jgi:5'/3'-nucleotidase
MRILCTNDDGYLATGIQVLASAARRIGEVTIVAPDREQSATSHSLTLHNPLRARRAPDGAWVVGGTPTDCVLMAVGKLLPERPDICVSGVNHGPNMGEDVLYSGTVAAAMEATVLGVPAVAFSYAGRQFEDLPAWEDVVHRVLEGILGQDKFPADTLFSVNLPPIAPAEISGIRVTSLGRRRYSESITQALDPMGKEYYWIGGGAVSWSGSSESDFGAVDEGYVSVTPLHLDLTNYGLLEEIRAWDLTL